MVIDEISYSIVMVSPCGYCGGQLQCLLWWWIIVTLLVTNVLNCSDHCSGQSWCPLWWPCVVFIGLLYLVYYRFSLWGEEKYVLCLPSLFTLWVKVLFVSFLFSYCFLFLFWTYYSLTPAFPDILGVWHLRRASLLSRRCPQSSTVHLVCCFHLWLRKQTLRFFSFSTSFWQLPRSLSTLIFSPLKHQ